MAIHFYSTKGEFGAFSNFAHHPFVLDGTEWPTSEHYFQAQKFASAQVKLDIMRTAVWQKFASHAALARLLLATGDEDIVEAAPRDAFWGCGKDGQGQNWLGRILMEIRAELKSTVGKGDHQ
jgi:predicted NAD-dependent protein-ADP-ribosyltransferase YbiA (DUF1768 family)